MRLGVSSRPFPAKVKGYKYIVFVELFYMSMVAGVAKNWKLALLSDIFPLVNVSTKVVANIPSNNDFVSIVFIFRFVFGLM